MELKKLGLFSVVSMLAMSSLTFSACGDDDDDDKISSNSKTDSLPSNDSLPSKDTIVPVNEPQEATVSGNIGDYTYVDLGLASKTMWATCNVGASTPIEYGDYFAWGETSPKEKYEWSNYKWCEGSDNTLTKYCVNVNYGTVDSLASLLAEDDAATANWGADWRMPTLAEQQELLDGCNWKWTDDFGGSGVAGQIGVSKTNGNVIFLPAAGYRSGADLYNTNNYNNYWSSSFGGYFSFSAYNIYFVFDIIGYNYDERHIGRCVRAVAK